MLRKFVRAIAFATAVAVSTTPAVAFDQNALCNQINASYDNASLMESMYSDMLTQSWLNGEPEDPQIQELATLWGNTVNSVEDDAWQEDCW